MTLDELRRLADALPAGASVTLSREALLGLCGDTPVPPGREIEAPGATSGLDLTAAQLAERLGRKPSTIRGWCEQGRLPGAYRLNGREWRIPPAALEAFLQAQRPHAPGRSVQLSDWRTA